MKKEIEDFYNGVDELPLTDELIEKLIKEKKMTDAKSLKKMADMGAKWNVVRNSLVFPCDFL